MTENKFNLKYISSICNIFTSALITILVFVFFININAFDGVLLRVAVANDFNVLTKVILYGGANVHADNDISVQIAAKNGNVEIVRYLIERGADIHARNDVAIYFAIKNGHIDIVRLLLDKGGFYIPLSCESIWLQAAKESSHPEIISVIRERVTPTMNSCSAR